MKCMNRNKSEVYYCLYDSVVPILDEYGNDTGEYKVSYKPAKKMSLSVSAAFGEAQMEQFGKGDDYDKVMITDDMDCDIDENTVLFIEKQPEYNSDGSPLYDYVVKRVAKSMNFIFYAVSRVDVK